MEATEAEKQETLEIVAPFMRREVVNELCSGRHWETYRERKLAMLRRQIAFGIFGQRMIARHNATCQARTVDGLGQWKATIDPDLYFAAIEKYGYGCWRDKDFLNHTLRHTPEIRAPRPAQRTFVVNGFKDGDGLPTSRSGRGRPGSNNSRRRDGPDSPDQASRNTGAADVGAGDSAKREQLPGRPGPGGFS